MDFTMKDFDCGAVSTAMNELLNVQNKKQFDIADVGNIDVKLENDEWNIDSIFNDLSDLNMDPSWTDAYDYMSSPTSTGTESENDNDMFGLKMNANNMLSPPQQLISSSQSDDSGLSSDHIDFDMNFDQLGSEFLKQPLLSTQIIPELGDESPVQHAANGTAHVQPVPTVSPTKIVTKLPQPAPVVQTIPRQNVTSAQIVGIRTNDVAPKPKVQFVKKLPTNIIQFSGGDAAHPATVNKAIFNENGVISPIVINKATGSISGVRKVIQVKKGPNQKSIILPISLKNGTDFRSIKIIKPSSLTKSPKILMAASNLLQEYKQNELKQNAILANNQMKFDHKYEADSDPSDSESYRYEEMIVKDDEDDDDDSINGDSEYGHADGHHSDYPKLMLSIEEKRLLAKEGIALPAHYPLTKHEERELKRIRRKIRNKISAQDSRKRKKEYVDGLEERVRKCTDENQSLIKRIKLLQSQNHNLMNQMKKMQTLLTKNGGGGGAGAGTAVGGGNKSVQPATCLMVLLMSMALIAAPNMRFERGSSEYEAVTKELFSVKEEAGVSQRALLFDSREKFNDALSDEEINDKYDLFAGNCDADMDEHNYAGVCATETDNKIAMLINDFDVDDTNWTQKSTYTKYDACHTIPATVPDDDVSMDVDRYDGMVTTHAAKPPRNLSDSPSEKAYRLNELPNIINLSAEIGAKNV